MRFDAKAAAEDIVGRMGKLNSPNEKYLKARKRRRMPRTTPSSTANKRDVDVRDIPLEYMPLPLHMGAIATFAITIILNKNMVFNQL